MKSIKPRKQRKMLFNAPIHKKRKWLSSHLEENLLLKYDQRSIPVITGDTIKVMRGSFKGHENKVANVHIRRQVIEIEEITTVKADGTKIAKPIHPSNVMITKLNLTDKWRRKKLEKGLSEETKKEIEEEAEEQIEEEKKLAEELAEEEKLEEPEEIPEEKKVTPEKKEPVEKTPAKTTKKKEEKPKEKEKPKDAKTTEKKEKPKAEKKSTKKKTVKKTPAKTTKKKEGDKK